jgi:hypothetical protein
MCYIVGSNLSYFIKIRLAQLMSRNRPRAPIISPQLHQDKQVVLIPQRPPKTPCPHFASGNN